MPLTYAGFLPVNARLHRDPGPGDRHLPAYLDLLLLSPEPARIWSVAGRRPLPTRPTAERWRRWSERWRLFEAKLDQEIRLAALTGGEDAHADMRVIIAANHTGPADSPAVGVSPRTV